MKIYLAGVCKAYRQEVKGNHLLVSFAEQSQINLISQNWDCAGWLLDSGAFSMWRRQKAVSLDKYMSFIDKTNQMLDGYFALDVIPGSPGKMPTKDEAKMASDESLRNLQIMELNGFRPIPVYHEGEPIELLDHLVSRKYPLIALGATASRGRPEIVDWLLPIFQRHKHQAFHGLAMTQRRIIEWLPFESVDSTTWLNFAKYGLRGNEHLLRDKTPEFYRRLGIECLLDLSRCRRDQPPAHNGQLPMFVQSPR